MSLMIAELPKSVTDYELKKCVPLEKRYERGRVGLTIGGRDDLVVYGHDVEEAGEKWLIFVFECLNGERAISFESKRRLEECFEEIE